MKIVNEISVGMNRMKYFLTLGENEDGVSVYGVAVSSTLFGKEEYAAVRDVSSKREFAEKLFYMLADNSVLPSALRETVGDYVADAFTV